MCTEATTRREKQALAKAHVELEATVMFTINGEPVETVEEFKYLGRVVKNDDNDEALPESCTS